MRALSFDDRIRAKFNCVVRTFDDMHGYQHEAYAFLRDNPFSHLFIDLGMGKTITSLTLIAYLLENFLTDKILVVGPLKVMTGTWPDEISLWEHTAPYNYTLIREDDDDPRIKTAQAKDRKIAEDRAWDRDMFKAQGFEEKEILAKLGATNETRARHAIRAELARSNTSIHFINKEQLEWLVNLHRERWPYRTVIIDELSLFKDHSTHVFKALAKVRNTPGLITRLHGLTATPAAETYEHLWSQVYLADKGERLGKNITKYRNTYFTHNQWTRKYTLREGAEEEILAKISDICLVMKREDYFDVDEPMIVKHPITLPKHTMELYKTMQEDFVVTLPDGSEVEAENAAALSGKLLQMASGVLYETKELLDWETEDVKKIKKVHHLHDEKIEALREIYDAMEGEPLLVAYHFKSSLDRLKRAFPKAVVMDRDGKCVKDWNAKKIKMLLIHPKSGGHGLNMQYGGSTLVFFDLTWSLELFLQLIGRLARQGQTRPVVVKLLTAIGTLDDAVCAALEIKEDAQDRLFVLLKGFIERYKKLREKTLRDKQLAL